ncbi:DUF502 domain-containing protein [Candidatus Protochlamydia phocaeensis]|uniref:DUF502 domain-containing protein n=1 Tax=Candidatus Protochlamydia phocaeensis TaxID=1414722 RepID=UPI0009AE0803|nr:DUF502 domain-containing protein [Candidatus Protochlamydia phocaeensis]
MKKYFITGLVILLPVALTIAIVVFLFNLLTVPFLGIIKAVFNRYDLFAHGFLFLNPDQLENLVAQLLILASLFLITIGLGLFARWFFFRGIMRVAEYLVKHIPLVSPIYRTCKDVIKTLFTSQTNSFKQVVLVRFPNPQTYSIGLITREDIPYLKQVGHENAVSVFIPTTPNPTSGFLVIYQQKDLIYLDMKVEDAFKYIISCGVIAPPLNSTAPEKASPISENGLSPSLQLIPSQEQ